MKAIKLLLWLCSCFALASCTTEKVRDFMPGTYVNSTGGEFSIASDTLILERIEGNNYRVFRHTGYNLIRNGKAGPREFETEVWACVYSPATKTLTESRKGKVISFYPDRGVLQVSRRMYEKMK